jgi:hypothetical protein
VADSLTWNRPIMPCRYCRTHPEALCLRAVQLLPTIK